MSPKYECLSPDLQRLSPEGLKDLSTESIETGDNRYTEINRDY